MPFMPPAAGSGATTATSTCSTSGQPLITVHWSRNLRFRGLAEAQEAHWQRLVVALRGLVQRLFRHVGTGHGTQAEFDEQGGRAAIIVLLPALFQLEPFSGLQHSQP